MPITDDNEIKYEFQCYGCGYEETDSERGPRIPLRECPKCDDGKLHHVGPVLDTCDKCGQDLLYHGCSGLGSDTLCETCYERLEVMM